MHTCWSTLGRGKFKPALLNFAQSSPYTKGIYSGAGYVTQPVGDWSRDEFEDGRIAITMDKSNNETLDQRGWFLPNLASWTIDIPLSTNCGPFISEDGLKYLPDRPKAIETIQRPVDLRRGNGEAPTIGRQSDLPLFETSRGMKWRNPEFAKPWYFSFNLELGSMSVVAAYCQLLGKENFVLRIGLLSGPIHYIIGIS